MTRKLVWDPVEWCLTAVGICCILPVWCCIYMGSSIKNERDEERRRRKAVVKGLPLGETRRRLSISSLSDERNQQVMSNDSNKPPTRSTKSGFFSRLSFNKRSVQYTYRQERCLFLTSLPYEVRLLIYDHVMRFNRAHLVHLENGKIQGIPCDHDGKQWSCTCVEDGVRYPCTRNGCVRRPDLSGPATLRGEADHGITGVISLLQTCRVIYTEFISVLYSRIFEMRPLVLLGSSVCIPPHRFNSISKLELYEYDTGLLDSKKYLSYVPSFWERRQQPQKPEPGTEAAKYGSRAISMSQMPESERITLKNALGDPNLDPRQRTAWEVACIEVLPQMTGLRELRVKLNGGSISHIMSPGREATVLRPLCEVRLPNLKIFEVQVNWIAGYQDARHEQLCLQYERGDRFLPLDNVPFTLVRVLSDEI